MPRLGPPGARFGLAYLWAIVLSPMLLQTASVVLLAMGFWRHVDSVAAIGAIGVVASLILPRMEGAFEIGPAGIKGGLESEFFRAIVGKALELGEGAERAIELATDAAGPPTATQSTSETAEVRWWLPPRGSRPGSVDRLWPSTLAATRARVADLLADQVVGESVRLGGDTAAIVDRVANEREWRVNRNVRMPLADDDVGYRIFDFVIETRKGTIFIETVNFRRPEGLSGPLTYIDAALHGREFLAAFVVVPDRKFAIREHPNVEVVPVGDLERRLRELSASGEAVSATP
jgi:hypothetical protein